MENQDHKQTELNTEAVSQIGLSPFFVFRFLARTVIQKYESKLTLETEQRNQELATKAAAATLEHIEAQINEDMIILHEYIQKRKANETVECALDMKYLKDRQRTLHVLFSCGEYSYVFCFQEVASRLCFSFGSAYFRPGCMHVSAEEGQRLCQGLDVRQLPHCLCGWPRLHYVERLYQVSDRCCPKMFGASAPLHLLTVPNFGPGGFCFEIKIKWLRVEKQTKCNVIPCLMLWFQRKTLTTTLKAGWGTLCAQLMQLFGQETSCWKQSECCATLCPCKATTLASSNARLCTPKRNWRRSLNTKERWKMSLSRMIWTLVVPWRSAFSGNLWGKWLTKGLVPSRASLLWTQCRASGKSQKPWRLASWGRYQHAQCQRCKAMTRTTSRILDNVWSRHSSWLVVFQKIESV